MFAQQSPDGYFQAAVQAQQRGDFATAIADYRKVLAARPKDVEAKVNLGAALAHEGKYDAAIAEYESALISIPQNEAVRRNLALAYYKKGDYKSARGQFQALHAAQPGDLSAAILLGDTDVHLQDAAAAVGVLEPMAAAGKGNPDFEYVLGTALIGTGKLKQGAELIQQVADATHAADAYFLAGSTLQQLQDFDRSSSDLAAALALNPKLPGIYTLNGVALDHAGKLDAAEADFREALKANPDDFEACLYLGTMLYKKRQMEQARPYLEHAVKLNPSSSTALYEFAILKGATGEYASAAADLEKVVHDDPKWLDPHVELASLYYKLHRPEDGARERKIVDQITAAQQAAGPGSSGSAGIQGK